MNHSVDWSNAPEWAAFYADGAFRGEGELRFYVYSVDGYKNFFTKMLVRDYQVRPQANDASVSIANLLNAQAFIAAARKASEFSEHNVELADQADAILQAIIGNLKAERIPTEASFHLANAQNELNACAKLLEGDKSLADAVFCIGEKLAGIRKGEL